MTRLSDVRHEHRAPHLVTVLDGRAHVVPVTVEATGDAFRVDAPGGSCDADCVELELS